MATETLYIRADEIKVGDILPDVSRVPVAAIEHDTIKGKPYVFRMANGFMRRANYGGPDYGYECFRVERAVTESEEDYVRACDAQHAANTFRLEGEL